MKTKQFLSIFALTWAYFLGFGQDVVISRGPWVSVCGLSKATSYSSFLNPTNDVFDIKGMEYQANQNIGYNQPTHTVYYLGSDYATEEEIWAASGKASRVEEIEGIDSVSDYIYYDLTGRRVVNLGSGLYIHNGEKIRVR